MAPPPASFLARVRRVLAFVAIVWSVAATFVIFEVVSLRGMDLALSFPGLMGGLTLSRTVTQSTTCSVPAGETGASRAPGIDAADGRVVAWSLGVNLGRDAVLRQLATRESAQRVLADLTADRSGLAARVAVRPPDFFRPQQLANANTEFVAFVEQGPAGETSRQLATAVSSQACELFKLGALWGYSEMIRPLVLGERAVFAQEIRHHAMRAGVPEALWSPMLERTATDAKAEDVITSMEALTNGVSVYLAGRQ